MKKLSPYQRVLRADKKLITSFLARGRETDSKSRALALARVSDSSVWVIVENSSLAALAAWRRLPWDSDVLQIACGRAECIWAEGDYLEQRHRLAKLINHCVTEAQEQGVCLLSLRLDGTELASLHAAEKVGFRVIESYLTFARNTYQSPDSDKRVRLSVPSEVEIVSEIAYDTFRHNRFLVDPLIPEERARHSRRDWVRNAFAGRAEAIYVAEVEGNIAGFILLRSVENANGQKVGLVDLIGIAAQYRGCGLGSALVLQSLYHYHGKLPAVEVGTQVTNVAAVNLYTRLGFRLVRSEFTLHWHEDINNIERHK